MPEQHEIVEVREERLAARAGGVRVRARLSSCPSRRWSRGLRARLASELAGHGASRADELGEIVHGEEIVLDRVATGEAPALTLALDRAVAATNRTTASMPGATGATGATADGSDAVTDDLPHGSQLVSATPSPARGDQQGASWWFG